MIKTCKKKSKIYRRIKSTFNLPTFNSGLVQSGNIPCKGNSMTLGLTNDSQNAGLIPLNNGSYWALSTRTGNYGTNIGTGQSGSSLANISSVGITTDSTKSGIIADTSSLTLSCNMIIKF